jgi:hypothetical protein
MTGRYAIRSGNGTVPLGEGVYGLVQWEVTMAEMLSEVGYATGMYETMCYARLTVWLCAVRSVPFSAAACRVLIGRVHPRNS